MRIPHLLGAVCCLASMSLTSTSAIAGSQTGLVTSAISATPDGKTIFSMTGTHTSNPACSTTSRWAFDNTTPSGQAVLSQVLSAISMGRTLQVVGTGACTNWADSEDARYVYIYNY